MATRPRVYLHTLGCPKNDADSASLTRRLRARGAMMVDTPEEATHLLLNTCGFIEDAKAESVGAILAAAAEFPDRRVMVMGCLVQRYRRELEEEIPEVTDWFGLGELERLVDVLASGQTASATGSGSESFRARPTLDIGDDASGTPRGDIGEAPDQPRSTYAYLKISDGCDHRCSFCAIPGIKGPYAALPVNDILEQAEASLSEGARELILVGQDTALWASEGLDLLGLLRRLAEYDEVLRLRLLYLQPEHVSEELLHFIADHPKLCRYLDIPFQHASTSILRRMRRQGTAKEYLALLRRARDLMPDVLLRSTFIVGFPGETEDDFERLLDFVQAAGFHYAGAFQYSREEGTPAAELSPRVPARVARDRLRRASAILLSRAEVALSDLIGSRQEVLVDALTSEEGEEAEAIGRIRGQAPDIDGVTYLTGLAGRELQPGMILSATVTELVGLDLVASVDET